MFIWFVITTLVLVGLGLVLAEIFLVPGTTLVGIFGLAAYVGAVWMSFTYKGDTAGWITLYISLFTLAFTTYFGFRKNAWKRFALKNRMEDRVNESAEIQLKPGQEGLAITPLKPGGKAEIAGHVYEVQSIGDWIERNTPIIVTEIEGYRVRVKAVA